MEWGGWLCVLRERKRREPYTGDVEQRVTIFGIGKAVQQRDIEAFDELPQPRTIALAACQNAGLFAISIALPVFLPFKWRRGEAVT
jgi:hypothetical protein